ncbi:hypothetical protein LINGRAHAP2_LOCUS24334, partial [Linum grandiflorum]
SHLDDSDGEPNPSNPKDQHRCSPRNMHNLWKSTTVQRRNMCRRRGFGFVEHLCEIRFRTDDIQFFIKNYNTVGCELKVAEGKVVRFTEEDVERVYRLYRGGSKVSLYIEDNDIDDLQIWASDLKLPCSSKGNLKIPLMESRLAAKEDDEKWFMLLVMLLIRSLFKPQAGVNMKTNYLGIFFRADAPPIEDYNWCQHLLEIFDEAKIGKKGYTEANVNLMLIMMLDHLGVEPGDRVPVLRPTVRYWTSTVMKNRLQQIDDIGGFQNCYIINWDKLAEAEDVIWFESNELRPCKEKPGMELSTRPAKKGLLALGLATKCLPAEKSTFGVSKAVSSVGANKGPPAVGGFGAAGFNPFHFPFTRLAIDHLSSDEIHS